MKVRKLNKANFETDFTTKKKGSLVDIKNNTAVTSIRELRIILDISGSVKNYYEKMISLIKESLYIIKNPLGCKIMVSISVFSTNHRVIVPFTNINDLNIESIPFPDAYGYTRTGQAILESVDEVMSYYENLKRAKKESGLEVYPPVILLITDGKTYGGQNETDINQNWNKYKQAALKIQSLEKLPPSGLDKIAFFACGLEAMIGSASKQELQMLTHYPERIFTVSNSEFLKDSLAQVMYYTITTPTQVI